ncbi:helix-turn-helix domain-containing protein [Sphingobium sp. DEHP117]|jgi:IclR family pca regulon transcriptional regulator|uniref:IclR family transcriptional regulator domain-containing protein n=1 Tax=Sphingobium sp. DEHP117 TaxID=2993436 RepID=UPI0027D6D71E|nr:IclR family transcriptional regulator C-terminal domain-containing protein [Sphingobium sp. DEHP117]MDQ4422224.1 helix-turn-helix domain-containing protein [Sphingobium sp. DEHP117]
MGGLAKGLAIIELFGIERPQLTVADAANGAGMTRAAARRCLLTLEALGYVQHDGKYFTPRARLRRLGGVSTYVDNVAGRAQPLLEQLCEELNEPISLAVLDNMDSLFVARAEATHIVSTGVGLGGRLPAYCSATGRVLLGGLEPVEIDAYLDRTALLRRTSKTVTDPDELRALITRAREEKFSCSDEELELGMRSMAVPVFNSVGDIIAACSLSTSAARVSLKEMHERYLPLLRATAAGI